MKAILVKMQCLTNMHVGNGDINYNIIDNEVERDPVTGLPTINSSGVKGALRQYFWENENVSKWFGDEKEKTEGMLKILPADMMAMPLRASKGNKAFYLVAPQSSVDRFEQLLKSFDIKNAVFKGDNYTDNDEVMVEGMQVKETETIAGDKVYTLQDEKFRRVELPVMARNCLENGISNNLWYEEIVPHHTTFVFPVVVPNKETETLKSFKSAIDGQIVQFGGNASIGYGLCLLTVAGEV